MGWKPTEEEIETKLIEVAYAWGDVEESLDELVRGDDEDFSIAANNITTLLKKAFRVEARYSENGFGDPCTIYAVLFDVADSETREAARRLRADTGLLNQAIKHYAQPWHSQDYLEIIQVPRSTPVEGQICRRLGEEHPAKVHPSLDDVPTFIPAGSTVPLEERGPYFLTPIEAPFYDALAETGLTFSVQPWIQHADTRYRVDFLFHYDGRVVAVELDGHESHKTKEQRGSDAARERWLLARGIRIVRFTGSQVFANVQGCIRELLDVVRQSQARP